MDLSFQEFGAMAIEGLHYPFGGTILLAVFAGMEYRDDSVFANWNRAFRS